MLRVPQLFAQSPWVDTHSMSIAARTTDNAGSGSAPSGGSDASASGGHIDDIPASAGQSVQWTALEHLLRGFVTAKINISLVLGGLDFV